MKKCPYCAEEIQDEAIKCKHCGEFLDGRRPPPIPGPHSQLPWYFRTTVIVIALLSVGPLALPMIWWHPRLKTPWKIGISAGVVTITVIVSYLCWLLYQWILVQAREMDIPMNMLQLN